MKRTYAERQKHWDTFYDKDVACLLRRRNTQSFLNDTEINKNQIRKEFIAD